MTRRYLFGPVTPEFREQYLARLSDSGASIPFDSQGLTGLAIGADDSWEEVQARFPAGWEPDFLVLALWYTQLPPCLWSGRLPIIGLAADWNLLWHYYRRRLHDCDLVLTDTLGVQKLHLEGIRHARFANLYGCPGEMLNGRTELCSTPHPHTPPRGGRETLQRDIDILFVGNLHPAVQSGRLPWLARLSKLADRWNVQIYQGVFGDEYRDLLARARIVFNRSIRGECNKRVFEAAATGALLFQEEGNLEIGTYFQAGEEYISYREENLEELLDYYLSHEDERAAIAESARARVPEYSFANLWHQALELIEAEWTAVVARHTNPTRQRGRANVDERPGSARSPSSALVPRQTNPTRQRGRTNVGEDPGSAPSLARRVSVAIWEALSSTSEPDPTLESRLKEGLASEPADASLHNALGLLTALTAKREGLGRPQQAAKAVAHFERAAGCDPNHVVAGLNFVEALAALGRQSEATQQSRRLLAVVDSLETLDFESLDTPHFPVGYDFFSVEWERAAWGNAGRPSAEIRAKRELLRWRLHALLGDLTGDVAHYYEAVAARPDLPTTQAALGCALCRSGRAADGIPHLRRAVEHNPFDLNAARALYQALGDAGDAGAQHKFARERALLAKAAPRMLPPEPWFLLNLGQQSGSSNFELRFSAESRKSKIEAPAVLTPDPWPLTPDLASIIILCCNQLEYTRLCLESVLEHTRPPYELILVDNGSTDETAAYLASFKSRSEPQRVVILRNEENLGFGAGCNLGLSHAAGAYLVLLNNDTVVTAAWLDDLISCSHQGSPSVGLVGPMSNGAPAPQQVSADYTSLDGLPTFAARPRRDFAGKSFTVERLTGFCLLIRREVFEHIGLLDEQFGLGFFEDDDLCVRAREAGFQLRVAQDVFIHHFGNKTFSGLGIDCRAQLQANFERFKAKWGNQWTAGYRLAEPVSSPWSVVSSDLVSSQSCVVSRKSDEVPGEQQAHMVHEPLRTTDYGLRTHKVSLCMIVRNEEHNLPACLESVCNLVDEIVVVDTGSTDKTRQVAERYGAKVSDFPWVDSFAAARNESVRRASGDWIFWLDADDRIDGANRAKLHALFARLGDSIEAFVMKCVCLPDPETGIATVVDHVRLFRNHPQIRWEHRVHEQILPAVRRLGGVVHFTDIAIHHGGYLDASLRQRKRERDLRLLQLEFAEQPSHPFTLFNLGTTYLDLDRPAEALPLLRQSLQLSVRTDSIVRKLYYLIVQGHRRLGQNSEALTACREGQQHYPKDAELLSQEAQILLHQGQKAEAEARFLRLLGEQDGQHFASIPEGLRGYITRHNLAALCAQQGRWAEAQAHWQAALAEQPDYGPALAGLGEAYLAQARWPDLEETAERLRNLPRGNIEGDLLLARAHLARREFESARGVLEHLIAAHPRELRPRLILSHVLLQEDQDAPVAEQALRDVLALDPQNREARHNLAVLLQRTKPLVGVG